MKFAHVAQRGFNRPVMILPEKAEILVYEPTLEPDHYYALISGVVVISIQDTLVHWGCRRR